MNRVRAAATLAALFVCMEASSAGPARHACELLQRSALEAAIGASLKDGRKVLAGCVYDAAGGKGQVTVQVRYPGDPLNDFADRQKAMQLAGGTLSTVAGLGDEASWAAGPDLLLIRRSGHLVFVDPGLPGRAPARERAVAIGRVALAALE
jgi:hypothetical protein